MPNTDQVPSGTGNQPQGSSYIYNTGTTPNTRAAVSQKVRVMTLAYGGTQAQQIGVVSSFSISQSKTVDAIRGIGFGDIVAELVPGVTDPETADFERALLYLSNLWQATGYAAGVDGPVRSLRHHRWPFDIEQQLVFSTLADADIAGPEDANSPGNGTGFTKGRQEQDFGYQNVVEDDQGGNYENTAHSALITFYEGCWFNSYSVSFAADSGMIAESGSVTITDTHDLASTYGEFLPSGLDPTIGQVGSRRFAGARVSTTP